MLTLIVVFFLSCSSPHSLEPPPPLLESDKIHSPRLEGYNYEMVQMSYRPGMSQMVGVTERKSKTPIKIKVTKNGEAATGEIVQFRLLHFPRDGEAARLKANRVITDENGIASVDFWYGEGDGDYIIGAFLHGNIAQSEPLITHAKALTPGWMVFLLFGLLGGLALFIYGMNIAGENIQKALGNKMRLFLGRITSNRYTAMFAGAVVSSLLQSSSAATVLLVGFVAATMMTLAQAIGVILGVKIGTAVTIQLISFNISQYSLAMVGVGFLMMIMGRRESLRHFGAVLMGFGLIFFGMDVMSTAMLPLKGMPEFTDVLLEFSDNTYLSIIAGFIFTAIIQSSGATVGLVMALSGEGFMSLSGAFALSMGASVGTCATALLASLGTSRAGKRVAVAHLLFSIGGVLVMLPFLDPFLDFTRYLSGLFGGDSLPRQIANAFTLFGFVTGIVFLPLVGPLKTLTQKLIPYTNKEIPFAPIYINSASLASPQVALDQAKREVERMLRIFGDNLYDSYIAMRDADEAHIDQIISEDDKLDTLEKAIRPFLASIAKRSLSESQAKRLRTLIYITEHIEGAGDLLTKEVLHAAVKLTHKKHHFSPEGFRDLRKFHHRIYRKYEKVDHALVDLDREHARQVISREDRDRQLERELRDAHLNRLIAGGPETVESSAAHLSVLSGLYTIGKRLNYIASEILELED